MDRFAVLPAFGTRRGKAQIVFWLSGATDGHAKNFSLFLLSGGHFRLTPLHDLMSAGAGISTAVVQNICYELTDEVPGALDSVLSQLPEDFPPELADLIVIGARRRVQVLMRPRGVSRRHGPV